MVIPRDPLGHASELVQQGRLPEARAAIGRFLAGAPEHAQALHLAGMVELMSGAPAAAVPLLRRCVEAAPAVPFAWSNLGVAFNATGDFTRALDCFRKTLELQPGNATAMKNQGIALRHLGRHDDAMASFRRAAQREPNDAELHREVGDLLVDMGRFAEALPRYDRAIAGNPRDSAAHHNRGFAAWRAGLPERAFEDIGRALALAPDFARAHATLAAVLVDLGLPAKAAEHGRRAVEIEPGEARWHNGLGVALYKLGRFDDAVAACDRALALDPEYAEALENRGAAHNEAGSLVAALADHERAFALDPGLPCNPGNRLHIKLALCDWAGYDELLAGIRARLEAGHLASQPFALQGAPFPPALHRRCSELYARDVLPAVAAPALRTARPAGERIRVGYFSGEFHDHPVAYLVAPLVEAHDRARFEVTAFAFGSGAGSAIRTRLEAAFERFEDVRALTDAGIAALARERGLDIAVDLMGYTGRSRTAIFAHRAAPIQAQYLGFPGTMGTPCYDYLVADDVVVPRAHYAYYSERIVALPDTYQVNDAARAAAAPVPARAALGLPAEGLVLCSFNNALKISPAAFDAWMRLLAGVPGSVLWLVEAAEGAMRNLRAEAARRGVAPERLVFAPRVPIAEHLARVRAADLALDTFPYNGHATTSDTLLAGVPVVTFLGEAFPGRVSASLLAAVGMDRLVAASRDGYEALALHLATDAKALGAARDELARNRATHPLFDAPRFARNLERAYGRMLERHRAGQPPDHLRA